MVFSLPCGQRAPFQLLNSQMKARTWSDSCGAVIGEIEGRPALLGTGSCAEIAWWVTNQELEERGPGKEARYGKVEGGLEDEEDVSIGAWKRVPFWVWTGRRLRMVWCGE